MWYKILADGVTAIHLGYVAFVVVAQLLIIIGWMARWSWVRNFRFRVTHLIMVEVVALEGFFGILCPLTTWEDYLRAWSRGEAHAPAAPMPAEPTASARPQPSRTVEPPENPPPNPATNDVPQTRVAPAPMPPAPALPIPPTAPAHPDIPPPQMPVAKTPEVAPDPALEDSTFVGRLLGSILYVSVDQAVLDRWYVGFGAITLLLFLLVPPRLGTRGVLWPACVVCLWIGPLLMGAAYYDLRVLRQTADTFWAHQSYQAFAFGLALVALGLGCLWAGRKPRTPVPKPSA
jgi:hypothetical protein